MAINTAAIYAELKKINARTENNKFPSIPSPPFLQGLLFDCEMHTVKIEKFYIEVTEELDDKERLLRNMKTTVEIKKRQALIGNDAIKKLPTGKEREAAVDDLFEDNIKELLTLENDVASLNHLETIIRHVQSNLNRTNANVRMLAKLMEQQINRLNVGLPSDPETKDLLQGLGEVEKLEDEMDLDDVESSTESVMPIEDAGGSEATSALTTPTAEATTTSSTDDIDVTALFSSDDSDEDPNGDTEISEETTSEEAVPEQQAAQSKTAAEGAQINKGQPEEADESVTVMFDGGGLDIDDIDAGIKGSEPVKTTPAEQPKKTEEKALKETSPPPKAKEGKEASKDQSKAIKPAEDNIDIDDILNSM